MHFSAFDVFFYALTNFWLWENNIVQRNWLLINLLIRLYRWPLVHLILPSLSPSSTFNFNDLLLTDNLLNISNLKFYKQKERRGSCSPLNGYTFYYWSFKNKKILKDDQIYVIWPYHVYLLDQVKKK